ncbi:MAG: hypothetical protein RTU30_15955, partial [Candidatus Thorarchaeota archaeon]
VFVRRIISGRVVWTPVMILDIKTKAAIDFNMYSELSRSRKDKVPSSYVWKAAFTKDDWDTVIRSTPADRSLKQLYLYEKGLLQEYRHLIKDDAESPKSLWKGLVIVDPGQSYSSVFDSFKEILNSVTGRLYALSSSILQWTVHTPETSTEDNPRVALVLTPSRGPGHLIGKTTPLDSISVDDPFAYRVKDDRILTQYISVASPTSYGKAAAWISKNWCLLNHLNECQQTSEQGTKIVWLDLSGDYPIDSLLEARFGLKDLHRDKTITTAQFESLIQVLQDIQFHNLSTEIDGYIAGSKEISYEILATKIERMTSETSIVVIDGLPQVAEMTPPNRQHRVRTLERVLLDSTPSSDTNIIWVDDGSHHTKMNSVFQRTCVRPLAYDSPRQTQVDEIIWNLPLTPRVLGWQAPQRADVRVIVQDTPTDALPWRTIVHVPHLREWSIKFRGSSRRDKTVSQTEVIEAMMSKRPMYERSVSLSAITAHLEKLTQTTITQIQRNAMTIAPSLLRRGATEQDTTSPQKSKPDIQVVSAPLIPSKQPSFMTGRLNLCPDKPPPRPNRSKTRYFPLSGMTRGWKYGSIPTPEEYTDDWQGVSRRPPMSKTTGHSKIDSLRTRRRELRRLLYTARFLKDRLPSQDNLYSCCEEIIQCCDDVLSKSHDADILLRALKQVQQIILKQKDQHDTWRLLSSSRLQLVEILNTDNRKSLQRAMDENQDLLTLYGNNLFLAVYTVAESVFNDTQSSAVLDLWSAVAEWQLYQMGFKSKEITDYSRIPRYDFQAIYSNLLWRAKTLSEIPHPDRPQLVERFGQAVWTESDHLYNVWLVFPDRYRELMNGGLMLDQPSPILRQGWSRCVIDPEQMKETAEIAIEEWDRTPIVVTSVNGHEVLWMREENEDGEEWKCEGVLEYGAPPDGKNHPIRWLRVSQPPPEVNLAIHGFIPSSPPSNLAISVNQLLRDAGQWTGDITDATCLLSVDTDEDVYRIEVRAGTSSRARVLLAYETPYTRELVRFLRRPQRTGQYLETDDGTLLRWDHLKDVEYQGLMIVDPNYERNWLSLTLLKPLVHRHAFYPEYYSVPQTCKELLETEKCGEVRLIIEVDDHTRSRGLGRNLRVRIDGISENATLHGLTDKVMGLYDLALLCECEQVVDVERGIRHNL